MRRYEERLVAYRATDFDDLIVLPMRLLAGHDDVRDAWRERLRYILVDEYQDTNGVQYELMKLIAGPRGRFTAVGDDDQSIYGWRGATVENLKRLPADYPSLKVIPLEQNYRSTGSILAAANAVIGHNPKLFEKKLWSDLGAGEPVALVECDDETHEAERAVARIESRCAAAGAAFGDIAILYRANHQARVFEQALRKAGVPYKVSGGQSFFERAEIRDLCAWLRLIVNEDDDPAFLRARDEPEARHRPPDARRARRIRAALEGEPVRSRSSPSRSPMRCRAARSRDCRSSAAPCTRCRSARATRPAPMPRRRSCSAG